MRRAFALFLLLGFPIFAVAQTPSEQAEASQPTPKPRLKIGGAMEGGGALGIAHIGVLQWFEEQHVPVDFIAGTSMGGLVGGFYASGVSPADMKTLVETLDWDEILSDRTPYQDLSFLRKQDQHAYPNSLVIGLRRGLYLPAGLNAGHQIGLVNNLPTDVVRQMGADIVIAVHLETQPIDAKDIQSLLSVLEQSVRAVISASEVRGLANADAVVSVPLGHFLMRDFTKSVPIMQAGYEAAKQKSKLLAGFALDDASWNEYLRERDSRKQPAAVVPQFIQVQGTSAPAQKAIRRYLKDFVGKPLNADKLDPALTQLTGSGRYNTLDYRIVDREGKQGLLIIVKEKDFAPPTLHPAFEVDGSEAGDIEFTLGTRLTLTDVAGFRSEWRTDFLVGNTYGLSSELYRPFRAESKWFVAPHASASDTTL